MHNEITVTSLPRTDRLRNVDPEDVTRTPVRLADGSRAVLLGTRRGPTGYVLTRNALVEISGAVVTDTALARLLRPVA